MEDRDYEELLEEFGRAYQEYYDLSFQPDWWTPEREKEAAEQYYVLKEELIRLLERGDNLD